MSGTVRTLKKFDIPSLCKIVFFSDLILMLLLAIPFSFMIYFVPAQPGQEMQWIPLVLMLILHPLLATAGVAAMGSFYNLFASKLGGIKVYIE